MNESRRRQAQEFARLVMVDSALRGGLEALLEVLEGVVFERWKATEAGEGWRKCQGELAAIRELGVMMATIGGESMSEEMVGGSSGEPVVSGRGTLTQESSEVTRIGALLRGEKDAGEKPKGEPVPIGKGSDSQEIDVTAGEEAVAGDGEEAGGEDSGPLTVRELAKSLGVKEGELFDEVKVEVEVSRADGTKGKEEVSLGDLRRGYVAGEKLERERESFEAESDRRSLEFMQARAELEKLGELIGPHAPREVVDRLQGVLLQREARERALLLEAVPEWKDAAKFAADRTSMIEFLKPWGFSSADVYAIGDHRIARFVRDMARNHKRVAEAERKARERGNGEVKRSQAPDGRVSVSPLRVRLANIVKAGKSATTPQAKTDAIGALLRATHRGK